MRRALATLAILASLTMGAMGAGASTDRHDVYRAAATNPTSNLTFICYEPVDEDAIQCSIDFAAANNVYATSITVEYLP